MSPLKRTLVVVGALAAICAALLLAALHEFDRGGTADAPRATGGPE